ncbi:MAG: DUF1772 domain-containing protein [Candidatus Eisenbacteria bacterium]|uniref:DUF1772 domain-containing protein n=1 Tax=Eiseniibacteriota bacterium TaxID=2212470 RepID=A0A538T5A6_UNCEI|nr:MAG: DUF1772 domain-containing protein [Candidatus Eisenbacteria bacterium]
MLSLVYAATCAGLFAGAALFVSAVQHPARISRGAEFAVKEFVASYPRAAVMQSILAVIGTATGLWSAWLRHDAWLALAAILLASAIPFTLLVILPTNKRLLDPSLDPRGQEAPGLLARWGHLHAARTAAGVIAFAIFLARF